MTRDEAQDVADVVNDCLGNVRDADRWMAAGAIAVEMNVRFRPHLFSATDTRVHYHGPLAARPTPEAPASTTKED